MTTKIMQTKIAIAMLLPLLAGCETYVRSLGPTNLSVADAKEGQDCRTQFLMGGLPDLTGAQAMRAGGITRLRTVDYRVDTFSGVGSECVIARGE